MIFRIKDYVFEKVIKFEEKRSSKELLTPLTEDNEIDKISYFNSLGHHMTI